MSEAVEVPGYRFLGWGPRATGPGLGWSLASDLFGRCGTCGGMLRIYPDEPDQCPCGRLFKDARELEGELNAII